jgi:cytochrome P450
VSSVDQFLINDRPVHGPVIWSPTNQCWDVFGYEEARTILENPEEFSSDVKRFAPEIASLGSRSMIKSDPPRHTWLRGITAQAFSARQLQTVEPYVRSSVDRLLDQVAPTGMIDVIDDLAKPLPVLVIAEILGIPEHDRTQFGSFVRLFDVNLDPNFGEFLSNDSAIKAPRKELESFLRRQIIHHKQNRHYDLICNIINTKIDGRSLTPVDIMVFCSLLLIAGTDTTTNLIGNAVRSLLSFPDALNQVNSGNVAIESLIEETLRFASPIQVIPRYVARDTIIGDQQLLTGEKVAIWLGIANRDNAQFVMSNVFMPERQPNRHLGFGYGPHFCLGASLARMESRVALIRMLERLKEWRATDWLNAYPIGSAVVNGVRHLRFKFRPERH